MFNLIYFLTRDTVRDGCARPACPCDKGRPGHHVSVELPIGVFDSGVGGTRYELSPTDGPAKTFLHLADTARLPYGTKSPKTIEQYLVQNMKCLLQKGVKAIVVAC